MREPNKTIGIIGGAGPMAGALLLSHVINICQRHYGCKEDGDFPKIILLSIPFAQMLKPSTKEQNEDTVTGQLNNALDTLIKYDVSFIGIGCNTLHGFIENIDDYPALLHLVELTRKYLIQQNILQALVLGSQTSAVKSVHAFDRAIWPNTCLQKELDEVIDLVLEGNTSSTVNLKFRNVVQRCLKENPSIDGIILGCTELSVLMHDGGISSIPGKPYIDPLVILAEKLCEYALGRRKNTC